MRSTLRVNPGEGIGSISSRFSRLKITTTTLLMYPIMSILRHRLQCIHPREFVILQDMRHLILIQGQTCVMPMLKPLRTLGHFLMIMCSSIWVFERLLSSSSSFALLPLNNLLFSYLPFFQSHHLEMLKKIIHFFQQNSVNYKMMQCVI